MREHGSIGADVRIAHNAEVDPRASIGAGSTIWGLACIRENAVLGEKCIVGRGAYIEDGVVLGDRVKIQTNALVFTPTRIGDDVFIGPAVVITNDRYPRSSTPDGQLKREDDWTAEGVVIDDGASIGARAVILPGVHIGRFALVAAGAVVTRDVARLRDRRREPCPVRRLGGSCRRPAGAVDEGRWACPATGAEFVESVGVLTPVPSDVRDAGVIQIHLEGWTRTSLRSELEQWAKVPMTTEGTWLPCGFTQVISQPSSVRPWWSSSA